MKFNTAEVAQLQPDYLGFIFFEKSPRNFEGDMAAIPSGIKKVGVFVDATLEIISEKIKEYKLNVIQLHGDESPNFCERVRRTEPVEVWKVFGIKDQFDFNDLKPYEPVVDKFLFDTKGKEKGGTGYVFDWSVLNDYPSTIPFVLSGGIGPDELEKVNKILKTGLPIYAIDVNSRFESKPGLKNISALKKFKNDLQR